MPEITKDWKTEDEKVAIIDDMVVNGWRLIEEQRYFDGNHLIFTDEPYIAERTIEPALFKRLNPTMGVEPRLAHIEDWLEK